MSEYLAKADSKIKVKAEQYLPGKPLVGVRVYGELAFLDRLEGDVPVDPGDWIVTLSNGSRYVVSNPVFERLYERVA